MKSGVESNLKFDFEEAPKKPTGLFKQKENDTRVAKMVGMTAFIWRALHRSNAYRCIKGC